MLSCGIAMENFGEVTMYHSGSLGCADDMLCCHVALQWSRYLGCIKLR